MDVFNKSSRTAMSCKRLFSAVSPEPMVIPTELTKVDSLELLDKRGRQHTQEMRLTKNLMDGTCSTAARRLSLLGAMAASSSSASRQTLDSVCPPERKRRRVCFALPDTSLSNVQQAVEPGTAMTEQEQQSYWYSREDLKSMKREAKRSCQLQYGELEQALSKAYNKTSCLTTSDSNQSDENQDVHDLLAHPGFEAQRGLERWSSKMQMLSRCVTIVQAKTEVMLEQVNQQLTDASPSSPDQQIAEAMRSSSLKSARYARLLALSDAQIAAEIHSDDDDH